MSDLRYTPHVATVMSGILYAEAIADGFPLFSTPLPYCVAATIAVELFCRIRAKKKVMRARQRHMTTKEIEAMQSVASTTTVNYNTVPDARQAFGERMYK